MLKRCCSTVVHGGNDGELTESFSTPELSVHLHCNNSCCSKFHSSPLHSQKTVQSALLSPFRHTCTRIVMHKVKGTVSMHPTGSEFVIAVHNELIVNFVNTVFSGELISIEQTPQMRALPSGSNFFGCVWRMVGGVLFQMRFA